MSADKRWKRGRWVQMSHASICDVNHRGVARYILYQTDLQRTKEDADDIARYLNERDEFESRAIAAERKLEEMTQAANDLIKFTSHSALCFWRENKHAACTCGVIEARAKLKEIQEKCG